MNVGQLKKLLENIDDSTPVHFVYDYGDHGNTDVTTEVADVEEGCVLWSDYHDMFKVAPAVMQADDDRKTEAVVLLRG